MKKQIQYLPFVAVSAFFILGKIFEFGTPPMKAISLILCVSGLGALIYSRHFSLASPIHKGMVAFLVLAALAFWISPDGGGRLIATYPAATLYAVLFFVAVGPPILGRDVFTMYFARKTIPRAVWETDVFKTINYHLTALWAVLFFCSFVSGLLTGIEDFSSPVYGIIFEVLVPTTLMLGIGLPGTRFYPDYYQRKLGLTPVNQSAAGPETEMVSQHPQENQTNIKYDPRPLKKMEVPKMSEKPTIVAINGSPHAGAGSTSMMIEMMRDPLAQEGFQLDVINLAEHEIDYCYGCAFCLEKGKCWIDDHHRSIARKLLAADGIVMASPDYVLSVTAQMKAFLDRSLGYGHKPLSTWKPGLAVCVSAGLG